MTSTTYKGAACLLAAIPFMGGPAHSAETLIAGRAYLSPTMYCYITNVSPDTAVDVRKFEFFSPNGRLKPADVDNPVAKVCPKSGTFTLRPNETCAMTHESAEPLFKACRAFVGNSKIVRAHGVVQDSSTTQTFDIH